MTGDPMSDSTVRRLVRRLGHSRKKDPRARLRARGVREGGLASDGFGGALCASREVFVEEMGSSTSLQYALYA
jgi:hypothetical protein